VELNARDQLRLSRLVVHLEEVDENVASQRERTFYLVDELSRGDGHDINIYKKKIVKGSAHLSSV
jgi:hypothetical protein